MMVTCCRSPETWASIRVSDWAVVGPVASRPCCCRCRWHPGVSEPMQQDVLRRVHLRRLDLAGVVWWRFPGVPVAPAGGFDGVLMWVSFGSSAATLFACSALSVLRSSEYSHPVTSHQDARPAQRSPSGLRRGSRGCVVVLVATRPGGGVGDRGTGGGGPSACCRSDSRIAAADSVYRGISTVASASGPGDRIARRRRSGAATATVASSAATATVASSAATATVASFGQPVAGRVTVTVRGLDGGFAVRGGRLGIGCRGVGGCGRRDGKRYGGSSPVEVLRRPLRTACSARSGRWPRPCALPASRRRLRRCHCPRSPVWRAGRRPWSVPPAGASSRRVRSQGAEPVRRRPAASAPGVSLTRSPSPVHVGARNGHARSARRADPLRRCVRQRVRDVERECPHHRVRWHDRSPFRGSGNAECGRRRPVRTVDGEDQ